MEVKESIKLLVLGLMGGLAIHLGFSLLFPELRDFILMLLKSRSRAQESFVEEAPGLGIFINNLLASLLCSYGGVLNTAIFIRLKSKSDPRLRALAKLDKRVLKVSEERLRFYLSLFTIPVFILLFTGLTLGFISGFYTGSPGLFVLRLYPHGIAELPAIVISGSVGLSIAESALREMNRNFSKAMLREAKHSLKFYAVVPPLLALAAYLEA